MFSIAISGIDMVIGSGPRSFLIFYGKLLKQLVDHGSITGTLSLISLSGNLVPTEILRFCSLLLMSLRLYFLVRLPISLHKMSSFIFGNSVA